MRDEQSSSCSGPTKHAWSPKRSDGDIYITRHIIIKDDDVIIITLSRHVLRASTSRQSKSNQGVYKFDLV
jgi:hypothetical protein